MLGPSGAAERRYTVRLHFAEPDALQPGERVFDVSLQGKPVLDDLDIMKEAGGAYRGLIKEFHGVMVGDGLRVHFSPIPGSKRPPLICGIEIVAEGW